MTVSTRSAEFGSRDRIVIADLLALRPQATQLDISELRRASSVLVGGRRSAFRGRGMDFEESRAYQPGDDVRSIDWRVTARRGEPHTKIFKPERERPVILLIDIGQTMAFASEGAFKSVLAARVGALVAWMASGKGDRVGAFVVADAEHTEIRPSTRPATTLAILNALESLQASPEGSSTASTDEQGAEPTSGIDKALGRLAHAAPPGSLVFIISDFWAMTPTGEHHFAECARRAEVICGFVFDPFEQDLPGTEGFAFSDGTDSVLLHGDDPRIRQAYRARFDGHVDRVQTLCRRNRAHFLALCTKDAPLDALRGGLNAPRHVKPE